MCNFSDHPFVAVAARYFFETINQIIQNLSMEAAAAPNALLKVAEKERKETYIFCFSNRSLFLSSSKGSS
jgi:hypothetical protein